MAEINWNAIRTDYITSTLSYRDLEAKYGVCYRQIAKKGKAEGWGSQRSQHNAKVVTKILDDDIEQKISSIERLETVADKVLTKVEAYIDACDPTAIDTQSMKHITGVLKDIKDVMRNRKDLKEQDARIKKLQKEAEQEDTNTEVVITFGSEGKKQWAE
jgi:regulator of sigma D